MSSIPGKVSLAEQRVLRYNTQANPGVAQLVARVVWDHEAAGSIPVTRTNAAEINLSGVSHMEKGESRGWKEKASFRKQMQAEQSYAEAAERNTRPISPTARTAGP